MSRLMAASFAVATSLAATFAYWFLSQSCSQKPMKVWKEECLLEWSSEVMPTTLACDCWQQKLARILVTGKGD